GSFAFMGDQLTELMHEAMSIAATKDVTVSEVNGLLTEGMITMAKVCAPALAAAFVLGMALNVGQVGFMFTLKPITPDVKKLNPVTGFKNLINKKKLVELLKTAIKFVVVAWLSYIALKDALRDVVMTIRVGGF
ncbi:MAG: EscU/YscU/HrcU family type III secretion system export apparatus switch protein, partial [Deltaproteobacteria bacterium]|nr:EscU/YscU/HrcU family type III secretion system export apparatus switch protein [Deltaproteobacteria bacterium]